MKGSIKKINTWRRSIQVAVWLVSCCCFLKQHLVADVVSELWLPSTSQCVCSLPHWHKQVKQWEGGRGEKATNIAEDAVMTRDFADCESWLKSWRWLLLLLLLSSPAEISVFIFDTCFFIFLPALPVQLCSATVLLLIGGHNNSHTHTHTCTRIQSHLLGMLALAHINTHTHREQFIHTLTEQVRRVVGSSWLTGVFCTYFFGFLLFGFFFAFLFCFRFCWFCCELRCALSAAVAAIFFVLCDFLQIKNELKNNQK